jgi:HTH-type transcriptional regulator / antitoxin HigA
MKGDAAFEPTWASPPGETIAAMIERKGIDAASLAELLGERLESVESLLAGNGRVTRRLANALADAIGGSSEFWVQRDQQYQDDLTRRRLLVEANDTEWLGEFPLRDLTSLGWLPLGTHDRLSAVLAFFGVDSIASWRNSYAGLSAAVSFRTSPIFASNLGAVLSWLRKGAIESEKQPVGTFAPQRLRGLLPTMRELTRSKSPSDFLPKLTALCNSVGVALVVAPAPKGCRASGATWLEANGTAICLLSHRYRTDDQFWFSFFHELAHLILHRDRSLHLEDGEDLREDEETEANEFAESVLIAPAEREMLLLEEKSHKNIIRVARRIGVSPGIVVGQLQHFGALPTSWLNKLKRQLDWETIP